MNETEQKCLALFAQQETEFKTWMRSYWECAYYLHWIKEQLSLGDWNEWLDNNFHDGQQEVIGTMIRQLRHTATGRAILAATISPDHIVFPNTL